MKIRIVIRRDYESRGFLIADDKERELHLHCKIYIFPNNQMVLEKFMNGSVGEYEFHSASTFDSLAFKGKGSKKPASAEEAMRAFIEEVAETIRGMKLTDFEVEEA